MLESAPVLKKSMTGSGNSIFSDLIQQLGNSDWVRSGMEYISDKNGDVDKCPFCQQSIDRSRLKAELTRCFDETYQKNKQELDSIFESYKELMNNVKEHPEFGENPMLEDLKNPYLIAYREFKRCIEDNCHLLERKVATPSVVILLNDSSVPLSNLNAIISQANERIKEFNVKIERKEESLNQLKEEFWKNMRWKYDQVISDFEKSRDAYFKNSNLINERIKSNDVEINKQRCKLRK